MSIFVFYKVSTSILQFFNKILTSLSTVCIILQLLKWPCRTSFFIHVECLIFMGRTPMFPHPALADVILAPPHLLQTTAKTNSESLVFRINGV